MDTDVREKLPVVGRCGGFATRFGGDGLHLVGACGSERVPSSKGERRVADAPVVRKSVSC